MSEYVWEWTNSERKHGTEEDMRTRLLTNLNQVLEFPGRNSWNLLEAQVFQRFLPSFHYRTLVPFHPCVSFVPRVHSLSLGIVGMDERRMKWGANHGNKPNRKKWTKGKRMTKDANSTSCYGCLHSRTGQYELDQKHRLGDREQAVILEPVVTQGPVKCCDRINWVSGPVVTVTSDRLHQDQSNS